MTVKDLKDLKKLIQLCQEQGVDSIKVDGIEMVFGNAKATKAEAVEATRARQHAWDEFNPGNIPLPTPLGAQVEEKIPGQTPSEEELLFWSAQTSEGGAQ